MTPHRGMTACEECPEGKFENYRRECKECDLNLIDMNVSACRLCEVGRYAPAAVIGECILCGAGHHTNGKKRAATTCDGCFAGKYANLTDITCKSCSVGRSSKRRAAECTICEVGKYADSENSPSCYKSRAQLILLRCF